MAAVLKCISGDLVTAVAGGIQGVDPVDRPVHIFIYMAAMMGKLFQVAAISYVLVQSANTLRTLCCMCKYGNDTFSETKYSSEQPSGPLPLVRFNTRHKALRACNSDKLILQKLEM